MLALELLAVRSHEVVTVTPNTPVSDAARITDEHMIGAVAVVSAKKKVLGILLERDILKAVGKYRRNIDDIPTKGVMTRKIISCALDQIVVQRVHKFDAFPIRRLVVMDGKNLVDRFRRKELLKWPMAA